MDIEGNEYRALLGARRMLTERRVKAIQIEFGGCNIDSRVFFKDYWDLLHLSYDFYRISRFNILKIEKYEETLEIFKTTNYLLLLK